MKKFTKLFGIFLISLLVIGSSNNTPHVAPEDCDINVPSVTGEKSSSGVVVYRWQVCAQLGTSTLIFIEWFGNNSAQVRNATSIEIFRYNERVSELSILQAETNLDAEIEIGKKAVEILREWSVQAMNIHDTWDSKTEPQKDALVKELFRRMSIIWDKQADDFVTRGLGQ